MRKSPPRQWDWTSVILYFLAFTISVWRLVITRWTSDLGYVQQLAWLGLLLGLTLGYSQFERRGVIALTLAYTLVTIPNRFITLYDPDIYLGERLMSLLGRWLFSIQEFVLSNPVKDQLFFVTILSIAYWFIGLASGYHLVRYRNYLAAALPAGVIMLVIQIYDAAFPNRIWLVAIYIFLVLALLGRQNYLQNRVQWHERRTQVSPETGIDLNTGTLVITALIILTAWVIPATIPRVPSITRTWDRLTQPWRDTRDRLGDAFASVTGSQASRGEFYRDELYLGSSTPQSEDLVFTVFAPPEALALPRLYWRGRIYDTFDRRWITSAGVEESTFWPSRDEFAIPDTSNRKIIDFTFNVFINRQATLYVASQPVWVSRPVEALFIENPDEERDIFAILASPYLEPGEIYHTRAAMTNPSVNELRAAGEEYPAWVLRRYLQLPEDFSPRIAELAQSITADQATPLDKTVAITDYLRENIEYSPFLEFPDTVEDPLEYVLFDLKKGFCNYYASAEVLMLRSIGIPARLAVGFSQGEANSNDDVFAVRQKDAHAWPEVYFPGYGWIEFEPTGNQDPLDRPEVVEPNSDEQVGPIPPPLQDLLERENPGSRSVNEPQSPGSIPTGLVNVLITLGVAIGLVSLYIVLNRRYGLNTRLPVFVQSTMERTGLTSPAWLDYWVNWTALTPIERSFETINRSLRLLDEPPAVYHTPAERAGALVSLLPTAAESIHTLVSEHHAALFMPVAGDAKVARRASLTIWLRTRQELLQRLWKTLTR